eukprot:SAG31_NODE_42533_length_271_cov_0.604651_1_plen_29_part_10
MWYGLSTRWGATAREVDPRRRDEGVKHSI